MIKQYYIYKGWTYSSLFLKNTCDDGMAIGQTSLLFCKCLESGSPYYQSQNLQKSQIPHTVAVGNQLPTFDAESKSAKTLNSLYKGGGGGLVTNFQLLMPSPNLLKSQIPIWWGGGGGGAGGGGW